MEPATVTTVLNEILTEQDVSIVTEQDTSDWTPERYMQQHYTEQVNAIKMPEAKREALLAEFALRTELHFETEAIRKRKEAGETVTYDDYAEMMDRVARKHGIEAGLPFPHIPSVESANEHPLILAERSPLAFMFNATYDTDQAQQLRRSWRGMVVNSWSVLGDHELSIVKTECGPMFIKEYAAGKRLRRILADIEIRSDIGTMTADAELRAVGSLKEKINENQFRTYMLSNMFAERSRRSDLHYIFRKGRPVLVLSFHGKENASGRVIAALCLHPQGFYQFSHVGTMVPTDEVIAQLLMMRGNEHGLWKKSGQWQAGDIRSGI